MVKKAGFTFQDLGFESQEPGVGTQGAGCRKRGTFLIPKSLIPNAILLLLFTTFCPLPSARAQQPQTNDTSTTALSQSLDAVNAKYVQGVGPGYWPTEGSGLALNLTAGTAVCNNVVRTYAGGTLTLAPSATNYVFLNTSNNCAPASNTTGFTATAIPIATVVTTSTAISTITDVRTMFVSNGATSSGSVTSVGMAGDGIIFSSAVSGSPVTSSGTLAPQLLTQTANAFLAGPGSGPAATPTFRALAPADLPATISSNTTGTAATATALAATPAQCPGSSFAQGITANGNANCSQPGFSNLAGSLALTQTPLTTAGDLLFANSTPALARLPTGGTNQFLGVGGGLPAWIQPAFSNLSGTAAVSQGGTGQTSASAAFNTLSPLSTEGDLLYYHSSANARLGVGGNGQCLVSNGGDPVWGSCSGSSNFAWSSLVNPAANLTLSMSTFATTFNHTSAANWTWANTTAATSGTPQSSPLLNLSGTYWNGSASATDSWSLQNVVASGTNGNSTLTFAHSGSTGAATLSVPNMTNTSTTQYGVLYGGGSSATEKSTAAGASGLPLLGQGSSAAPAFGTLGIAGGGTGQTTANAGFNALSPLTTEGDLLFYHSSANARLARGSNGQCLTSNGTDPVWGSCSTGAGTVTSVGLSMPSMFSVSGSPVTGSGTLAAALANQNADLIMAGPSSGSAAAPTFRALVGADLPAPTASTLGGVESAICTAGQFLNQISAGGVPACASPSGSSSGLGNGTTVVDASLQAGTDFGAKVNAAIAALPSTGGTVDARGIQGTQSSSASIVIPGGVTLEVCDVTVTFTVTPMFKLEPWSTLIGCGANVAWPNTTFQLSGTTGGSGIVMNGGEVQNVKVVGTSTTDGSIGFDLTSQESGRLFFSTATNFQVDAKIGSGSGGEYTTLFGNIWQSNAQYGEWWTGNSNSGHSIDDVCQGAQTCFQVDSESVLLSHPNAESFTVDGVAFTGSGNSAENVYIESGPTAIHYKSGAWANVVKGGNMSSISLSGLAYDAGVDQITNYIEDVWTGPGSNGDSARPYSAVQTLLFSGCGSDAYCTELDSGTSFGGNYQALQWSALGRHGPTEGLSGYAPMGLGGIENRGGINTWGSISVNALPGGSYLPAPTLACASSGAGATYTAFLVITDYNGNKTTPSSPGTVQCPNAPSVTYPITVTPATAWGNLIPNGVKCYDYLIGDTAHSFTTCALGPQNYTGTTSSYAAPMRNATGDQYVTGWAGLGTNTPAQPLELSVSSTSADQGFRLSYSGAPANYYGQMVQHYNGSGNGFSYNFNLQDADTSYTGTPFSISPHGNIGIGTASPGQKLDVAGGSIRSDTGFCISTNCVTSLWSNPMTTLGDFLYGGANGAATRLAGNTTTTPMYLKSLGSGTAATAPTLAQIQFSDIAGSASTSQLPLTIASNTSGNAATATTLAATPTQCSGGQFATGVAASGNANCATPSGGGNVSNYGTPTQYQTSAWVSSTQIEGIGPGTSGYPYVSGGSSAYPSFALLGSGGGGTGVSSPTAHYVPIAEGSSVFNFVTPSSSGLCFISNGTSTDPSFQTCPAGSTSFPLTIGGTANSGGIPYFSSTTQESSSSALTQYGVVIGGGGGGAPTATAAGAANMPLIGNGSANPVWSSIAHPSSVTSGGVIYASSTTAMASSALLAANALVVGGGAGTAPTTGNGDFTYATHTLTGGSSGIIDIHAMSPTAGFLPPSAAGAAPTTSGVVSFDSTNQDLVFGNGTTTNHDTYVTGSTPSPGIATFAGSTYAVTSVATTGSGNVVLAISPTLTTPNLGTPSAINLANATFPSSIGQAAQYTGVTYSATPTFTASSNTNNSWSITLTGNVTSSTLASAAAGQDLTFQICQDSTGSRTFTWPTGFTAATTIFPTASTCTEESFFWDGSNAQPRGSAHVSGSSLSALWYGPTGTAPGTPASGYIAAWFDSTDNALKVKNSAGTVTAAVGTNSCTNQVLTAISDSAAATCTSLTLASAYFANQGTTITVLHGNASGNPSFGAVVLTTDVSGVLPVANGGSPAVADTTTSTGTTAISANTCTSATTVTMTGVTTSMTFTFTPSTDVSGVTGWGSSGGLAIDAWPTSSTLNYKVCNQTGSSITPGSSVTWNVSAR